MPRIIGPDSDIVRRMFLEASETMGCTALFYELITDEKDFYKDTINLYKQPLKLEVIFDDNPKVKMLKNLGWYNEDEEIRPLLIYLPIYKNQEKDLLNVRENCIVEILYFGVDKTGKFRISAKRLDSLYGNYWVCKCVPERIESFTPDTIDGYEYLSLVRKRITVIENPNINEKADPSILGIDSVSMNSNIKLEGETYIKEFGSINDLSSLGIDSSDNALVESFFNDIEIPVIDSYELLGSLNNLESESTQNDLGIGESIPSKTEIVQNDSFNSDDYSSLVME